MLLRSVRGALRLALGVTVSAQPTVASAHSEVPAEVRAEPGTRACEPMPVDAAARVPGLARYELPGGLLPPFLALWLANSPAPLPDLPDRVAVFAVEGRPLVIAYGRQGCLLGVLPMARDEVWALLRRAIGPVA